MKFRWNFSTPYAHALFPQAEMAQDAWCGSLVAVSDWSVSARIAKDEVTAPLFSAARKTADGHGPDRFK